MNRSANGEDALHQLTDRKLVSVPEFAAMSGLSNKAAYQHVSRRHLPVVRLGRRVFVSVGVIDELSSGK